MGPALCSTYFGPLKIFQNMRANQIALLLEGLERIRGDLLPTVQEMCWSEPTKQEIARTTCNQSVWLSHGKSGNGCQRYAVEGDQRQPRRLGYLDSIHVLLAYRTVVQSSTGFTPHKMLFGREARIPIDLIVEAPPDLRSTAEDIPSYIQNTKRIL